MRILHLHTTARSGGAALAMDRLHGSLLAAGHESRKLVRETEGDALAAAMAPTAAERWLGKLTWRLGLPGLQHLGVARWLRHPWVRQADVIHLHNLHHDWFNYAALGAWARLKPLVWTLHDAWALTGHCAYFRDCGRWRAGCGRCPYLESYPAVTRDRTALSWRLKRRAYQRARPQVITPSQWLADCAAQGLLQGLPRRVIPYGLDLELYHPRRRAAGRAALGVAPERPVLLSLAARFDEPRKGGRRIAEALGSLPEAVRRRLLWVVLGAGAVPEIPDLEVRALGYVADEARKADLLAAADLLLFASEDDNLPLVIQESLACGTPVVATAVGGVGEMVLPGRTGWIGPVAALAATLQVALDAGSMGCDALRSSARAHAERHYGLDTQRAAVLEVYANALRVAPDAHE